MSESQKRVREIAQSLGISIADDRLEALAHAWEQALSEADAVRELPTPMPAPSEFDASWSEKR